MTEVMLKSDDRRDEQLEMTGLETTKVETGDTVKTREKRKLQCRESLHTTSCVIARKCVAKRQHKIKKCY